MLSSWPRLRARVLALVPVRALLGLVLPERAPRVLAPPAQVSRAVSVSLVRSPVSRLRRASPWRPRAVVAATARKAGAISESIERAA